MFVRPRPAAKLPSPLGSLKTRTKKVAGEARSSDRLAGLRASNLPAGSSASLLISALR
jgi:hypothetical protein